MGKIGAMMKKAGKNRKSVEENIDKEKNILPSEEDLSMKRLLAVLLTAVLLFGTISVHAELFDKYDRLIVATGTPFSGNFFSGALGNNISDQDVRRLIHGYSLVHWDSTVGSYQFNRRIITGLTTAEATETTGKTFTFAIAQGMTYNDGTPITAKDYAFSLLLSGSGALKEVAGGNADISRVLGGKDYNEGKTNVLEGFRILGDYQFSLTIDPAYEPYFYQLQALDIMPMPISVLAPGCHVMDDGKGAYISGPFSAELLRQTMTNPESGYVSHPSVTCGPYMLTGYNGSEVTLDVNPAYMGDENGQKPSIPRIIYRAVDPDRSVELLAAGEVDLVVRCARASQIQSGIMLISGGDFAMKAYSRAGLSFISFCGEKGPTADVNVRKAVAMCIDKQALTEQYLAGYGMVVNGYYGIGQWMFLMANGTLVPGEGEEAEWADLKLDNIPVYPLDPAGAASLLDAAGWNLNENGEPYDAATGGIRCKKEGGSLVPLTLKLIYPAGNGAAPLLKNVFEPYLAQAGIGLEISELPMSELLEKYYGRAERDCDMILLGTNFGDVFDPSVTYDEQGRDVLTGITDEHLQELAVNLRKTDPGVPPKGNAAEYCRRWLTYIEYRAEIVPEIPLYSDAYLDFHIAALRDYEPSTTGSWTMAITGALLSDYVPEEPEPAGGELEQIPD